MTITLSFDHFRQAAGLLRRIKTPTTLPILEHIRITVAAGEPETVLETSDLDLHLTIRLPFGGPTTPSALTIARADFFTLARLADKGSTIRLDCDPLYQDPESESPALKHRSHYTITATYTSKGLRTTRTFEGLDPGEFPPPPDVASRPVIFPKASLDAIRRVRPSASEDQTRYVLNGVFITPAFGGAVVATDGRRLAFVQTRIPAAPSILPNKLVDVLADPALQTSATWRADDIGQRAALTFGHIRLDFPLVQGNYPNYQQVMPAASNGSCTFPASIVESLIAWLRPHKENTIGIELGGGVAHITAHSKNLKASTAVPAHITGEVPAEVRYNGAFLADGLALGLHTLDLIDEMSPGVLTDGTTRYVLMPMRVQNSAPEPAPEPADESDESEPSGKFYQDIDRTDAPQEFVDAYDDCYAESRIPEVLNSEATFDRILAEWRAAGEPEDIASFIITHALAPEPQDDLPSASDEPSKPTRSKRSKTSKATADA